MFSLLSHSFKNCKYFTKQSVILYNKRILNYIIIATTDAMANTIILRELSLINWFRALPLLILINFVYDIKCNIIYGI